MEQEHHFLHDISSPLSVGYGNLRLVIMKLRKDPDSLDKSDILTRLEKSLKAFDQANSLLSDRRSVIKSNTNEETGT